MNNLKKALHMGSLTFIVAILVTLFSTALTEFVTVSVAIFILFCIVVIGIAFDIIGVAVTVAETAPLNAKAAKKIFGAKKALFLVKHAAEVATFCCDIVGDICGTVSGALGAVIALRIGTNFRLGNSLIEILMLALIAAITVGGKSYGKRIGIERSDEIIFNIGRVIASVEYIFDFRQNGTGGGVKRNGLSGKNK